MRLTFAAINNINTGTESLTHAMMKAGKLNKGHSTGNPSH